uniref:Type VI secretion protein n=1 Tax=Siphoviridae sp. ct4085 TaxID=2827774 RepID=A0A8S5SFF4_9CAUD|nr:MAG TPA: type VI secretion protein [Siphoviridae sp. ct4085]
MRTLLMLCLVALITGCSKDNDSIDETPKDVEMHFYAYTKLDPASPSFKAQAKFFLFDASNGKQFKEERINVPSGEYSDYSNVKSEMVTLLNNNEFELKDGTRIKPIVIQTKNSGEYYISITPDYKDPDKWNSLVSQNKVNIPCGKYYVVALLHGSGGWAYYDKYSGKYIEVTENMPTSDKTVEITFPHDTKHKGFIDWITTNW